MINHFHGVEKHMLDHKAFGCFRHHIIDAASPYLRGFSDDCVIPVSRWTEMRQDEIDAARGSDDPDRTSDEAGPAWSKIPATARSISSTTSNMTAAR